MCVYVKQAWGVIIMEFVRNGVCAVDVGICLERFTPKLLLSVGKRPVAVDPEVDLQTAIRT